MKFNKELVTDIAWKSAAFTISLLTQTSVKMEKHVIEGLKIDGIVNPHATEATDIVLAIKTGKPVNSVGIREIRRSLIYS